MSKTFYITTPIFYPNANLHMGHAYTTVLCDTLARYHRSLGSEVYFLTGSDENTEKVVRVAKSLGIEPKAYLDNVVSNFKDLFKKLEISHDQFIRTSDEKVHWPGVVELWKKIDASHDLEKRSYKGLYCVGHEAFITEKDLIDGKCPDHNEAPQILEEENYFFKLSKYTEKVKEAIKSGEFLIVPESRRNEILAQLERGLEDISFSRPANKVSVGIPVPGDPSQKMYVWCDALSNYITALGYGRLDNENYKKFWPVDIHVIGKDILRFHAAIWPAMLLSAGLSLPKGLLVHGFITSGGKKMSKTLGNVIDPIKLIEKYGAEAVRYYLLRHISTFEDGDLTEESFKEAYNANLANGLGNLVSRVITMAEKNGIKNNELRIKDKDMVLEKVMGEFDIQNAMNIIWEKITELDVKIQKDQPFRLIKTDKEKGESIIKDLVLGVYEVAIMLSPFMPETSEKIQKAVLENKKPENLFPRID
jgi:methionyl-tRNA synthetase